MTDIINSYLDIASGVLTALPGMNEIALAKDAYKIHQMIKDGEIDFSQMKNQAIEWKPKAVSPWKVFLPKSIFIPLVYLLFISTPAAHIVGFVFLSSFILDNFGSYALLRVLSGKLEDFIQAQDKEGKTALHYAAELGNLDLVKFLVRHGVRLDAADKDGNIPLMLACKMSEERKEIIQYLYSKECLSAPKQEDKQVEKDIELQPIVSSQGLSEQEKRDIREERDLQIVQAAQTSDSLKKVDDILKMIAEQDSNVLIDDFI